MVLVLLFACFKEPQIEPLTPRNAINIEVQQQQDIILETIEPPSSIEKTERAPRLPRDIFRQAEAPEPSPIWESFIPISSSIPSTMKDNELAEQSDLYIQWENDQISISGPTGCLNQSIQWTLSGYDDALWKEGFIKTSHNGSFHLVSPINITRRQIQLDLQCEHWALTTSIRKEHTPPLIQLYGEPYWKTEQANSFFITGAANSTMNIWGRPIGNRLWKGKYRIGMGTTSEWKLLHQQNLTTSFEKLSILIDDLFQQPYEIVIQILQSDSEKRFHTHLFSTDSLIGIHSPQSVMVNTVVPLHFLLENSQEANIKTPLTVRISHADKHTIQQIPIYKGTGVTSFTPTIGGLYHIVVELHSQRSETYLWVEGNNGDLDPLAIAFPTATYIGGLNNTMIVDGNKVGNGLLYTEAKEFLWLGKDNEKEKLPVLSLSNQYFEPTGIPLPNPLPPTTTILNTPGFLRLGDRIEVERIDWEPPHLQQHNHILHSSNMLPITLGNQTIPVLLSPSDQILLQHSKDKVYNSSKRISIDFSPAEYPYYLSTDPHFSDSLLAPLLAEMYLPHSPLSDAIFLQKVAISWDSLALRNAPWFQQVLLRAKANIAYLISSQSPQGHWGNPEQDWLIVHALLISGEQGILSSYPTMAAAAEYICSEPESIHIQHVKELLRQSIWHSLSCKTAEVTNDIHPIWKALWNEDTFIVQQGDSFSSLELGALLQYYAKQKPYSSILNPYIEEAKNRDDPWLEFSLWFLEKSREKKYTNMRVYEYNNGKGTHSGLFHTWQLNHLFSIIEAETRQHRDIVMQGTGSLHWTLWSISPQQRAALPNEHISVERSLQHLDGSLPALEYLEHGQSFILLHRIKGPPNQRITLSIFPAAGVSLQVQGSQIDRIVQLNQQGEAIIEDPIITQFKGVFQFPASSVFIEDQRAHSGDWHITIK